MIRLSSGAGYTPSSASCEFCARFKLDLPADVVDRLAAAMGLRNILAHMYLDIDHGRLFDELGWIDDSERFATAVEGWLARL